MCASTACPSATAVHLRCGWQLGGVQDRYFRYAEAGDEYVGRTVTGLNVHSAAFGMLPPHFAVVDDDVSLHFHATFVFVICIAGGRSLGSLLSWVGY
jgi:hypothetical protein